MALIEAERSELLSFISTYRKLSASVEAAVNSSGAEAPSQQAVVSTLQHEPRVWSTDEIVNKALEIVGAKRRPTKLGEIFDEMVSQGIEIGGKIPRNNLGAKLSAAKAVLRTIPGEGWWFANEPWPLLDVERFLDDAEDEYAKGPADYAGPSQMNGAAGHPPVGTWGE